MSLSLPSHDPYCTALSSSLTVAPTLYPLPRCRYCLLCKVGMEKVCSCVRNDLYFLEIEHRVFHALGLKYLEGLTYIFLWATDRNNIMDSCCFCLSTSFWPFKNNSGWPLGSNSYDTLHGQALSLVSYVSPGSRLG